MKTIQSYLFLTAILLLSSNHLLGQASKSSLQFGVGVNGLVSVANTDPLQIGVGNNFQLWLAKPIHKRSAVNLTLTYQQLSGYNRKTVAATQRNHPDEIQMLLRTKVLTSLHYLGAGVNWQFKFKEASRWSFGLGIQGARLLDWKGHDQETLWVLYRSASISEDKFSGGGGQFVASNEALPLTTDNFNRFDYGIQFSVGVELLPGLDLKTAFYQGVPNVFKEKLFSDGDQYRITTLSLGLSLRLF